MPRIIDGHGLAITSHPPAPVGTGLPSSPTTSGIMPGKYLCGDNARCDADGYYWIMGRIDDVLNVSGHRLSTIEIESALVSHPAVAEAAAVGRPHDLKGEAVAVFVTLAAGCQPGEELRQELKDHVRRQIGSLKAPPAHARSCHRRPLS